MNSYMPYEDRYKEFEQHLASGEPGVKERARNLLMAIGLHDTDQLKPPESLLEQAGSKNITNMIFI